MDDNAIIELFFARSEQAIRELDNKYGKVCHSLSYNILNSRQDAEECVNDAYLGTWDATPPALEELEGYLASPRTVERDMEEQELVRLVEDFLETLSPENRVLLMRRYWFSDSYGEIAERTGLSEKNVSVRLTCIRKQLRHYFEERGIVS